jgi:predicted Zn-dependent protease
MLLLSELRAHAAACLTVALCASCALPLANESELEDQGDKMFQEARSKTPPLRDASTRAYVNCVANAIISELEEPYASKRWEVEVFESKDVNAFALPGGHIAVYSALLEVTDNPSQLATVIGHEIAHVTRKHALQRYNRELTTEAGVIGATVALGGGSLTANALGAAAQLGLSLPFNRSQESEADIAGLDYMASAGFNPTESVPLWKNMEKKNKGGPPQFLSTHPSPDTRIQDLVRRYPEALQRYNKAQAAGKKPRCQRG